MKKSLIRIVAAIAVTFTIVILFLGVAIAQTHTHLQIESVIVQKDTALVRTQPVEIVDAIMTANGVKTIVANWTIYKFPIKHVHRLLTTEIVEIRCYRTNDGSIISVVWERGQDKHVKQLQAISRAVHDKQNEK